MKRSEVVKLIEGLFNLALKFPNEMNAENLLCNLEHLGIIRPPARWRPHDWNERGITYAQWIQEPSKIYEWEPEDGN